MYAVTTLNLLTKGRNAIGMLLRDHVAARYVFSSYFSNASGAEKVRVAVNPSHLGGAQSQKSWLKIHEIKALMSP